MSWLFINNSASFKNDRIKQIYSEFDLFTGFIERLLKSLWFCFLSYFSYLKTRGRRNESAILLIFININNIIDNTCNNTIFSLIILLEIVWV